MRSLPAIVLFWSAIVAAGCRAATVDDARLAAAVDLHGLRLGMTRPEIVARSKTVEGQSCTVDPGSGRYQLFLTCGPHKIAAGFTDSGSAWSLRSVYDLTGTPLRLEATARALVRRYGRPAAKVKGGSWLWPASPMSADEAGSCDVDLPILFDALETGDAWDGGDEPLSPDLIACLPFRRAMLPEDDAIRTILVEVQDPRVRSAGR